MILLPGNGMKYILDFDDCIFDTAKLKTLMAAGGIDMRARSGGTLATLEQHPAGVGVEWRSFVYPDAQDFLRLHGKHCYIVTSSRGRSDVGAQVDEAALRAFQAAKLEAAGVYDWVPLKQVHIVDQDKRVVVEAVRAQFPAAHLVMVDDRADHLQVGRTAGATPVQILRPGRRTYTEPVHAEVVSWPVIYSLQELPPVLRWLEEATTV